MVEAEARESRTGPVAWRDVVAIVSGTVLGLGLGWLAWWWSVDRTGGNYLHERFASAFLRPLSLVVFSGSGGLAGALWCWTRANPAPASAPLLGWFGSVLLGGAFAVLASVSAGPGRGWVGAAAVLGVSLGASLGARFRVRAPWPLRVRRVVGGLAFVVAVGVLPSLVTTTRWPGGTAAAERRVAWARAEFGESFAQATAFATTNEVVAGSVGRVVAVAPVEGLNRARTTPFGRRGEFTIAVEGELGEGVLQLSFANTTAGNDPAAWNFRGTWTAEGREPVELE